MKELAREEVVLALGYFDSVHLGHRNLISAAREYAHAKGIGCAVATFSNNAYKLFNAYGKQVYTYAERCSLLNELCDYVLPMRFDTRLKDLNAVDFLDSITQKHNVKAFVCGYDYLFGAGARGDAALLKSYAEDNGLDCIVVDKFELDGARVSTSDVKEMISAGDIEGANKFLGEPFFITGKVVKGRGAGRMFDIPTANLKVSPNKLLPLDGVYGTICEVDGATFYGATNVGARPTFGLNKTVVETMLADFNDNIYDKEIKVSFRKRLRGTVKFETPELLSKQVRKDIGWYKK